MTQLIATSQLTLTNVNDGQTPYVHFAYSDNADGTGFTTTDNSQRYIGHYSDYTQANSTDKTKYRWADRWAKIEVGGRNLWLKSSAKDSFGGWGAVGTKTLDSTVLLNGEPTIKLVSPSSSTGGMNRLVATGLEANTIFTYSFMLKSSVSVRVHNGSLAHMQVVGTSNMTNVHREQNMKYSPSSVPANKWTKVSVTFNTPIEAVAGETFEFRSYLWYLPNNAELYFGEFKLEKGNIATDWTPAPEDIQSDIDSKADQALTQEQINALNEKNQILEAEMQAKASMEAFSDLEKNYQSFVKANEDGQAKAEADLIEAGRRIELLTTQFGGLAELKTFIDTYMSSSNEGLIIGKNDASSSIKVSSDRISMFSAGKEVMYISQGVININNGIFATSVQIGKFRTEQYHLNADMNVIRYVGE